MSDQTTRPAPAALSEIITRLTAWFGVADTRPCSDFEPERTSYDTDERLCETCRWPEDAHLLHDALSELSRLRAGLTQAPELIEKLRETAELHTLLGRKCLCQRCMTAHDAADLLSSLLPMGGPDA